MVREPTEDVIKSMLRFFLVARPRFWTAMPKPV